MGAAAFASPIVLTKLNAASNTENITKKHISIDWPPESPDNQYHLNK